MTRRLALAICVAFATPAGAQSPLPTPQRLTCADAMALVKGKGSVLISPGGGGMPERFVRDRSQCNLSEIAELRFVPTRDNPECPIGYRCREPEFSDWDW